jgi:hypothetical protein
MPLNMYEADPTLFFIDLCEKHVLPCFTYMCFTSANNRGISPWKEDLQ